MATPPIIPPPQNFVDKVGPPISAAWLNAVDYLLQTGQGGGSGGTPGVSPIIGVANPPAFTIPSDSSGNVTSYTPFTGKFTLYQGTTDITAQATLSIPMTGLKNMTASILASGAFSILGLSSSSGSFVIQAVFQGLIYNTTVSASKTPAGSQGATGSPGAAGTNGTPGAPVVVLLSTPSLCVLPADVNGNVTSFSTATGTVKVFSGGIDVSAQAAFSLGAQTNCTATLTGQTWAVTAMSQDNATLNLNATYNATAYSTQVQLAKARAGATGSSGAGVALIVILTNEACTVSAYADGTVPSYAAAVGQVQVLSGNTDVTASSTFSAVASTGDTGFINTAVNTPVNGEPAGYYGITNMVNNSSTLTISATYSGITVTRVFSVAKVRTGIMIVSSLAAVSPVTDGLIVYLSTDGNLYKYSAAVTAWVPVVNATALTGQLTAAQIASLQATQITGQLTAAQIASISAAQLTGQITGSQIVAGGILAGNIAAGAITSTQIAAGGIVAANIAAGTILGSNIAAGTITGANLVAGTITANQIAANSITGNQILAGSITAAQIGVTSLDAISANVGTLYAGVIQTLNGSTTFNINQGTIIFNNGAFMKVNGAGFGSANQFIEWYGPSQASLAQCTEANAIYYLKTNGSAYFGGTLSAGHLQNATQATALSTGNVADLGPFTSNGGIITVTGSWTYASLTLFSANSAGAAAYAAQVKQNPSGTTILSRQVNGTGGFTDLVTTSYTGSWTGQAPQIGDGTQGSYQENMAGSFTYVDNLDVAQPREFKLRIGSLVTQGPITYNNLSLNSFE